MEGDDDVNSMFAEIEELRQNGWRTPKHSPQKLKVTSDSKTDSEAACFKDLF